MVKKLTQFFLFIFLSITLFGGSMTNEKFWNLIDETVKEAGMNNKKYLEILNGKLHELDDDSRLAFNTYVLYYAQRAENSENLLLLMKVIEGSTSDDSFLYFALWLVSRGENIYFGTLKNPDNFINLINPKELPRRWGSYYAPEFEMLMTAGRDMDEYGDMGEISDEELKKMDEIYEKNIPEDNRSYFDLARDIDNIFPESMKFFNFNKKSLEDSFRHEEQLEEHHTKLDEVEEKSFEELRKNWTFINMDIKTYNFERPRGGFTLNVEMPPHNDSIMFNIIGLNKMGEPQFEKAYWQNYKTKEIRDIKSSQRVGEYLTQDTENIYFINYEIEEGRSQPCLAIYNFDSNEFTYMEFNDDDLDGKSSRLNNLVGNGKDKSGTIYDGKIYFSISISTVSAQRYYNFEKLKAYTYDIKERKIEPLADNISNIKFHEEKMYYLKVVDFSGDYYYQNPKTLMLKDLSTGEETELLTKVDNYSIDGNKIYYSHKSDGSNFLSKYENEISEIIIENSAQIHDFSAQNGFLYLSLYMTIGHGGYIHSFLLNLKDKTIGEFPKPDQSHEVFLDDEKLVVMASEYDDRKIFLRVHEVMLR